MRYGHVLVALFVAACASEEMPVIGSDTTPAVPTASCEGKSASQCKFINSPVKLSSKPLRLPDSPYPFFKTRNTLEFVDANGQEWIAPAGILTDGASIPPLFVSFIGNPRSKEFLNAATVHDSYCAESNRNGPYYHTAPWQEVHRMLYDALRVSGTPAIKAKIMYAAVYLGGPRWKGVRKPPAKRRAGLAPRTRQAAAQGGLTQTKDGLTITATAGPGLRGMQADVPLTRLFSKQQLIAAFKRAKAHIEASNPSIADVEIYLTRLESDLSGPSKRRNFRVAPPLPNRDDLGGLGDGNSHGGGRDRGSSSDGPSRSGGYGSDGPATHY